MQPEVSGNPSGYWELLQEGERALTERRFALEGGSDLWDEVLEKESTSCTSLPARSCGFLNAGPACSWMDGCSAAPTRP